MANTPVEIPGTPTKISVSSSAVLNTPSSYTTKRALSESSTPSPSTHVQVSKKAKVPTPQPSNMESDKKSGDIDTKFIVQSVMEQISDQLKTSIAEHVQINVTAMANSVAAIITESFNNRIESVESENKALKEQVALLSEKIKILETDKITTKNKLDEAEQYSRRSCLRISGIPESTDEKTDDIVLKLAQSCGIPLTLAEIDRSHRVRSRNRNSVAGKQRPNDIIVKFVSYRSRAAFFQGKSNLKDIQEFKGVFINEDLTRQRADLLRTARLLVKNKSLLGAWSFDGRIFVKLQDGSRRMISSKDDITSFQ